MKFLVVGLGNPGAEYQNTRHNIGFEILDYWVSQQGLSWSQERHGWVCKTSIKGKQLTLLKPNTYMNLSGKAVSYWMQQEKTQRNQMLILLDDLALPLGKLRMRLNGSDGGHNGLKSINETLGTPEYPRLRFGIGSDFPRGRQAEFVLGTWTAEEEPLVKQAIVKASDAISIFVTMLPGMAMTRINAAG
jgi:PTH1 family peptidyl-tRNA hydrolase